jgi:hypothetical protein
MRFSEESHFFPRSAFEEYVPKAALHFIIGSGAAVGQLYVQSFF